MIPAASSPPRLFTLVVLTALSVLSLNMFLPSLSNIAKEFEADYALVNLSIAGYLGITALLQIIMGPLSDRFGRRPVLLAGVAMFALASLGCALAGNIWVFLAFRILQGGIIAGNALSRAVIRDMVPAQEAASLMGYVSMAMQSRRCWVRCSAVCSTRFSAGVRISWSSPDSGCWCSACAGSTSARPISPRRKPS